MKQLTDDQIVVIWDKTVDPNNFVTDFARAIIIEFCRINNLEAQPAADDKAGGEVVSWGAFHFGGKLDGKLYAHCDTEDQIKAYIAQVHQSNDSITLRHGPLYTRPQQQAIPAGYALVPVEPTNEMVFDGAQLDGVLNYDLAADVYRAMLAAAPKVK